MTKFSYQLYSSRNFGPLDATLEMLGKDGYAQVEGYGALYAELDALEALKASLKANNLHMATGHFSLDMVENDPQRVLDIAKELDIEAVYVPFVMPDDRPTDSAGWKAFGARLQAAGAPLRAAGLRFGWHNHDFEFAATPQGDIPLDLILEGGPDLELELDIAWVQRGGADPLAYIAKYADRISAAHVKDIAAPGENADEDGWADVGHGVMDWAALMGALEQTGAKYFVMEHDNPSDDTRFSRRAIASVRSF
ncbi:MAG: sugar phosphate isomerase/epimerase [Halocynthiibacter sp.]|jgi:sugar phosphate isomerase/epimerase